MKTTTANFIISLGFSTVTATFSMGDLAITEGRVSKACGKALKADIECHDHITAMDLNYYQKWVGDVELANRICTETCSDSFRSWNDTVTKDCAADMTSSDYMARITPDSFILTISQLWQGFNETCIKDTESGRYCQEILDGFSEINYFRHDRPLEELCHPCYGRVLDLMSRSFLWYNPDDVLSLRSTKGEYWRRELELVHDKCGNSNNTVTVSDSPTETATYEDTQGPTPDGPTDPGVPSDCTFYQTINRPLYDCRGWLSDWNLRVEEFLEYNPTVENDCSGIQLGHTYCVEVNNGRPRKESSPQAMTTEVVVPQPSEVKDLSSSQDTPKDGYMGLYEAGKQVVLEKVREFVG